MKKIATCSAVIFGLIADPVSAKDAGRYSMTPIDNGFLRLDSETGAVSVCKTDDEKWSCKSVTDDRLAIQKRIDQLEQDNSALSAEIARLEALLGEQTDTTSPQKRTAVPVLPSDEEVDKFIGFINRTAKKFKDMIENLKSDGQDETAL